MKKFFTAVLAAAAACACSAGDFKPIFDGDLSDATFEEGSWTITEDGVLSSTKDAAIFTKDDYENFEFEFEYMVEPHANSGAIIYCTNTSDWIPYSMEIQLCDGTGSPEYPGGNASIYGHVGPEIDAAIKTGEWQKMKIRAVGQKIDVWLNGKHATHMDMSEWTDNKKSPDGKVEIREWLTKQKKSEMATKGKVGFQGKHGEDGIVKFKNARIKNIK